MEEWKEIKGFVKEGKNIEDKPLFKKEIIEDKED